MSKRAQPNSAGDKEVPAVRLGHPWCHPKCPHDDNHCPVETEERYLWAVCMCQVLSEMDTFRQQLPKTLAVDNPGTWDSGIGRVCPASAWVQEKACMAAGSLRKGSALLARIQWLLAFPTPMPVSRWGFWRFFHALLFTWFGIWILIGHPEEPVGDGSRVHGWLDIVEEKLWHGTLVLLKVGGLEVVRLCLKLPCPTSRLVKGRGMVHLLGLHQRW